mgnify:CR=1 FL=1
MAALIDTGIFFGFYSLRDKHHLDSVAIIVHAVEGRWGRLFVTNHILDEVLTLLKRKSLPVEAFIESFLDSGILNVLRVGEEVEQAALELFKKRLHAKGFSFTDAVSEVFAKELNMVLLSYDTGFGVETIGGDYWIRLEEDEKERIVSLAKKFEVR